ncbi:imelysin family protein [Shimia sp.]|uniref:imelysin family protein n=1 Tax=Shimia sp. TaxID=1954381 RepID=UPI00329700AA
MVRLVTAALLFLALPCVAPAAPDLDALNRATVHTHILPAVDAFQASAMAMSDAATQDCAPTSPPLIAAFHDTFDAWTRMSHLRFGPTETNDRAFAIAFWPDGRGKTPKSLAALITSDNPDRLESDQFQNASIAARGLYALEFMLFDAPTMNTGAAPARCALIRAITTDLAENATGISNDWLDNYAEKLLTPTPDGLYRSTEEATQELFKALGTGLQFTSDTRLGRPLGTFDRPRPKRAELRRSERSLRQIQMSLEGTRGLALALASENPGLSDHFTALYGAAFEVIEQLDDPTFAGVADIQGRLRVEILQISIDEIRELMTLELGPALGVSAGFNALDGN